MSKNRVSDIRFVGDMTGVGITTPWDVLGTDLGIPVYSPSRRRMYFLFGDTFGVPEGAVLKDNKICAVGAPEGRTTNWRGTIAGYTDNFDLTNGIHWNGFLDDGDGKARALIRAHHMKNAQEKEVTKICQGGIEIDGALYCFYESIRSWGPTGSGIWWVNYSGVIKSTDGGATFERVHDLSWVETDTGKYADLIKELVEQDMNLQPSRYQFDLATHVAPGFGQMFALNGKDGYVYIYGRHSGRIHGIKVGRVKKKNFETFSEYEYLTGFEGNSPVWVKGAQGLVALRVKEEACDIVPAPTSNMAVSWNNYLDKWLLTYFKPKVGIMYCLSDTPYGPFTEPEIMLPIDHSFLTEDKPTGGNSLYGGFTHELLSREQGRKIILIISQWYDQFYNSKLCEITFD